MSSAFAAEPSTATAPTTTSTAPPQWLQEANARIEQFRKGNLRVQVVDAAGQPVNGVNVDVVMRNHAYGFGTAVNADFLPIVGDANSALYRQAIPRYFNKAVVENGMKWTQWESPAKRAKTIQTVDWLADHGLAQRGHTLLWQTTTPGYSLPGDVLSRVTKPNFTDADAGYVRGRVAGHIGDIVGRFADQVGEWDVVNEQWEHHLLTDKLNPGIAKERAPELATCFQQTRAAAPNAKLFANDYGILVGNDPGHRTSYFDTIASLKTQNAPIDGIGFQSHFTNGGDLPTPQELYDRLQQFGGLGLAMQATEFDMFGNGWGETAAERQANKAAFLREFYTIVFSQPDTTGITMWGFWDGKHWQNDAPLFNQDWTLKPAGEAYLDLVFHQWWTDETVATDAAGAAGVRGFLGDYTVTVHDAAGHATSVPVTLGRDGATARIVLGGGPPVPEPAAGLLLVGATAALWRRKSAGVTSPARS